MHKAFLILIPLLLCLCEDAKCQKSQVSYELVELDRLYRGYANLLRVKWNPKEKGTISLAGKNLNTSEKAKGIYEIVPGDDRLAYVYVLREQKGKIDTLSSKMFRVYPQPDPTLYLGKYPSGEVLLTKEEILFAKYKPDVPLNGSHRIINYRIIYGNEVLKGNQNRLDTKAQQFIAALPKGAYVMVECEVLMPDGEKKLIYGVWKIGFE